VNTECDILQASCRGEVDECSNGGRMIRGPVKTFKCECKEGYKGELCEKGTVLVNH
jgi:hypothetical protein